MRLIRTLFLILISALLLAPATASSRAQEAWGETVAPGIEYQEYHLTAPVPNNVFVTRMERNNPNVTLESSIGQGRLSGGGETVSDMAKRYDGAINYWDQTWGNRNQVVVAINGFYFGPDQEPPGVPWSGQVHSGWYAKRFWDGESGSGFAWTLGRDAFIGECITHPKDKQAVTYLRDGSAIGGQQFDGINVSRGANEFILYTPQYDATTGTGGSESVEVLVQLTRPVLLVQISDMTTGTIIDIRQNKGSTPIPFDHVVLSLHGLKKDAFLSQGIQEGDQVGISQRIKNCSSALTFDWYYTYASVGGAFYFLKDGAIQDFSGNNQANVRDPRTAIAYNNEYIFFIVVDGRAAKYSLGMTIPQLAQFARDTLGATYGIAQDGGGSSTMVVNGVVKNNPFCNIVSCTGNVFLPIVVSEGGKIQTSDQPIPPPSAESTAETDIVSGDGLPLNEAYYTHSQTAAGTILQRLVANGMMMVIVQPKGVPSDIFSENEQISTQFAADVRLGPGTNYAVIQSVPANTTGVIYGEDNGLNGVWAKGAYWWRVLLEAGDLDVIGWVSEVNLK